MSPEQLRLFIRQAFALSNREKKIIKGLSPAFLNAMAEVRQIVETLPPEGSLFREQAWRDALPQVRNALRPYNEEFYRQLTLNLAEEAPEMAEEAAAMIEAIGAQPAPQVPSFRAVPADLGRLTVADSVEAILKTQVNGKRVADLFEQEGSLLVSDWMRSNERTINRVVVRGILDGAPTEDIAENIVQIIVNQGNAYISTAGPTAARSIEADAKAIARTAVQDANRQVHEQVWQDNAEALDDVKWEWVAVLDSRTCPVCAPLDGRRWDEEDDAPEWPVHINCRCQVVPVDPDDDADVRTRGSQVIGEDPFSGPNAYKSKIKVDGENYYRTARQIKASPGNDRPTYADFLQQSNKLTREKFFGSAERARQFERYLDQMNMDPDQALRKVLSS